MQTKMEENTSFIGRLTGGISWRRKRRPVSASQAPVWSVDTMLLSRFIDKVCADDTADMQDVIDEYRYALANKDDRYAMDLERNIALLQFKIVKCSAAQFSVAYTGNPGNAAELVSMGCVNEAFPLDREKQIIWFKKVLATINMWLAELKRKQLELKGLQPQNSEVTTTKLDRAYFNDMLTEISKFMKSHVDENIITVGRYISILKNFRNYIDSHAR